MKKMQDAGCRMQGAGCKVQDATPLCPPFDKGGMKGGLFANWEHHASRITHHALRNERGLALVVVMIFSAVALAIMAGLIYMVTSGTQISGIQKRYKTALEASSGGAEVIYLMIGQRGDPGISLSNFSITASSTCLTDKLNKNTSSWDSSCSSSLTINPSSSTTYDMTFQLGTSPVYTVYTKIVDTVEGNSGGDEGLLKSGVVSTNTGEVTVKSIPYLYTIEIHTENTSNPAERAKLSVLYQY